MGNVSSRPEEAAALHLRDQNRLSISSLVVSSARKRSTVNIVPNAYPATRVSTSRSLGDNAPVEFVLDTDASASSPNFLLKLTNDEELVFTFTFVVRQTQTPLPPPSATPVADSGASPATADTQINNLTFVYASTPREVENLVTREFHADPNLHKNSNVELVGPHYATDGSPSVSFEWAWKWKPPRNAEDRGGGWRNCCSFVEYDQRAHRLVTLARFSFWVSNASGYLSQPNSPTPYTLLSAPPKIRVASAQSVESRISAVDIDEPISPRVVASEPLTATVAPPPATAPALAEPFKVDVSCPRPGEDVAATDDGPVFRATIKALEQKTGNMRMQMKRLIKRAEHAQEKQTEANDAFVAFTDALKEVSTTNANAVQPAIDHYFDKIAREILSYERQNAVNLHKIIIEPLNKLYTLEIKQAEAKKRDFEEESKDYYAYVGKYLGQRSDSVKTKKLAESDTKYQGKRRNFELKRFDYSSFMQDLSGGRKEQEVLSHLTKYADAQTRCFLATAKKVDGLLPQLEALSNEVQVADKEYQYQRREREEKRRVLEKNNGLSLDPEPSLPGTASTQSPLNGNQSASESELGRADSTGSQLRSIPTSTSSSSTVVGDLSRSPGSLGHAVVGSPPQASKFKGIRDLEERDPTLASNAEKEATQRKEGLLWSLSRPGGHVDPRAALNKQAWHKFWIVLDQGKLSEYSNWKQKLDLHMDPIDLRMASVREARNAERRFCFEVITPHFKRVYQATSEDDMNSWISAINNALQSAVEGRGLKDKPTAAADQPSGFRRDIGSMLTGKSPSVGHGHINNSSSAVPARRTTVGGALGAAAGAARALRGDAGPGRDEESPGKLLQMLRENDQGNLWCADCGSGSKVEWVSLNLAIILCIECSGIHRSLGTHISKIRSLTLDITSFTPDIVELLLLVGNRVSNMVWEAKLDPSQKPGGHSTREQRLKFITAKYVERAFVEPISTTLSHYATADETLLAAIKRNEVQQVLYALALRANPNVTDRSRGTHAVFLALAAANPAAPSPSPVAGAGASADQDKANIPFPVAELLLQNGAEIPATMPAFPLSSSAQRYIDIKRGRSTGAAGALSPSPPTAAAAGGAGLAPPPNTVALNSPTIGGTVMSPPTSTSAPPSLPLGSAVGDNFSREREARLQKRISAGGRLAKSPIPER